MSEHESGLYLQPYFNIGHYDTTSAPESVLTIESSTYNNGPYYIQMDNIILPDKFVYRRDAMAYAYKVINIGERNPKCFVEIRNTENCSAIRWQVSESELPQWKEIA